MELLDNKTSQLYFENIHAIILAGISTNKKELFKMNGYGSIFANYESSDNFYIFCFEFVTYTLQEDV